MVHWMVAHLDAVTSLAIDPSGLFLLSGSNIFLICFLSLFIFVFKFVFLILFCFIFYQFNKFNSKLRYYVKESVQTT